MGIPTHDQSGIEFNTSLKNKIKKEFNSHQEKYEKNLKKQKK